MGFLTAISAGVVKYVASFTNATPTKEDFRYAVGDDPPTQGPKPVVVHVVLSVQSVIIPAQTFFVLAGTHPHVSAEANGRAMSVNNLKNIVGTWWNVEL